MADRTSPGFKGVLELRIHGINNTSPASMLDLPVESIEQVVGDDLASFWREKDGAQQGLEPGDRGWRPPELTREAYSWGGLARNTPTVPGSGALSVLGRAIARVGWALLLPFGIANVAYWSRRLPGEDTKDLTRGSFAGTARLFALGLTLLSVVTACEVAMDQIATQCYRRGTARCDRLPAVFDVLEGRGTALRLVMAAALPLGLLLLYFGLSSVTRSRYERSTSPAYASRDAETTPRTVLLATPGLWSGDLMVRGLGRIQLAAGAAVVALTLSWPGAFGAGAKCREPTSVFGGACWEQVYAGDGGADLVRGALVGAVLLSIVVLLGLAVLVCRRAVDAPDVPALDAAEAVTPGWKIWARFAGPVWRERSTTILAWAALLDLLSTAFVLVRFDPGISDTGPLPGVRGLPTILVASLLSVALSGLGWRLGRLAHGWPLLAVALLATAFSPWAFVAVAGLLLALTVWLAVARGGPCGPGRAGTAWSGCAPGIFLGLSLLVTLTFASVCTVIAGDWLNGKNSAADLLRPDPGTKAALVKDACGRLRVCKEPDAQVLVPAPYVLFGAATLVALVLLCLLGAAVLFRTRHGDPGAAPGTPESTDSRRVDQLRSSARILAGRAHRAEKMLGMLVGLGFVSITGVVLLAVAGWDRPLVSDTSPWSETVVAKVLDLGTLTLSAVGVAVLAALAGGKATGSSRPLGLLWDLVCFLPRAAHPFGPPCYAERAVPEIVGRYSWWLDESPQGQDRARRGERIVISAHSLGSVLAVASLFALPAGSTGRFSLLTYGSQLRAYFGRIFPELLGPTVLGTGRVGAARLWTKDPWQDELAVKPGPVDEHLDSVVVRLGGSSTAAPRWRSLWRRTDFLGFPVNSYQPNDIDRPAEETDVSGYLIEVVTHGQYPRAGEYVEALTELVPESPRGGWRDLPGLRDWLRRRRRGRP